MFNAADFLRAYQQALPDGAAGYGLSPEQIQSLGAALMPAFALGLQRMATQPDGFAPFLAAMGSADYARFLEAAAGMGRGAPRGEEAMAQMFGSPDAARRIAEQTATLTGIGVDAVRQVLPVMAGAFAGAVAKAAEATGAAPERARRPEAPPNPFAPFLEAMATAMTAGMGAATRRTPEKPAPPPPANPFEEMMAAMMGAPKPPEPEPEPEPPSPHPFDAVDEMVRAGRALQDQHLAALRAIFDGLAKPPEKG